MEDVLQKHDVYKTYEIRRESLNVFWDVVVNSYEDFSWKKSICLWTLRGTFYVVAWTVRIL